MKKTLLAIAACFSFLAGFCTPRQIQAQSPAPRFDHVVRQDFFAGLGGDPAAMERAMKQAEAVLAAQPGHAEALVWHGAGLFFQSGQAFRAGENAKAQELWGRSLEEMDRAVSLAPDSIGVRIPRGATLLTAARFVPPQFAKPLWDRAAEDYSRVFELQRHRIATMPTHSKGELLSGLAEAWTLTGRAADAQPLLERMVREMANTPYARRSAEWQEKGMPPAPRRACIGCHEPSPTASR
jgi:hypothetical protein